MNGQGMLYARNGKEGVDRADSYGRSALTAVATADFSPLRELILQLLLLNYDGDPTQASVFQQNTFELQEWASSELDDSPVAQGAGALLRLDETRRSAWIAANLPPSPCPVLSGLRFLAPRPTLPLPRRASPSSNGTLSHPGFLARPAPPPRASSTSFAPRVAPRPSLPQRSFSDQAPAHLPPPPPQGKSDNLDIAAIFSAAVKLPETPERGNSVSPAEEGEVRDTAAPYVKEEDSERASRLLTPGEEDHPSDGERDMEVGGSSDDEADEGEGEVEVPEPRTSSEGCDAQNLSVRSAEDKGKRVDQVARQEPTPSPHVAPLAEDLFPWMREAPPPHPAPTFQLHAPSPHRPSTSSSASALARHAPALSTGDTRLNSSPYPSPEPSPPPASHPSKLAHAHSHGRKLASPLPPSRPLSPVLPRSAAAGLAEGAASAAFNPFAGIFALACDAAPAAAPVPAALPPPPSSRPSTFSTSTAPSSLFALPTSAPPPPSAAPPALRSSLKRRAPVDSLALGGIVGGGGGSDREWKKRRTVRWPANEGMVAVVVGEGAGWDWGEEEGEGGATGAGGEGAQ
ncbi:hypothetical protein JCM6882_000155 [Rhodosporidiobolus microsporus]